MVPVNGKFPGAPAGVNVTGPAPSFGGAKPSGQPGGTAGLSGSIFSAPRPGAGGPGGPGNGPGGPGRPGEFGGPGGRREFGHERGRFGHEREFGRDHGRFGHEREFRRENHGSGLEGRGLMENIAKLFRRFPH